MDYNVFKAYKEWRHEIGQNNIKEFFSTYRIQKIILLVVFTISGLVAFVFSVLNIIKLKDNIIILQYKLYIALAIYIISFIVLYISVMFSLKSGAAKNKENAQILQQKLNELGYKTKNQLQQLCNRLDEKCKKKNEEIQRVQKVIDNIFFAAIIPVVLPILQYFIDKNFDLFYIIYVSFSVLVLIVIIYVGVLEFFKIYKIISNVNIIENTIDDIHYILDHFFTVDDNDV